VPQAAEGQSEAGDPPPYRPRKVGPPGPGPPKRPRRWLDRVIGVLLGLLLGIGVIIVFVFKGREGTIYAPRISGINSGQPRPGLPLGAAKVPLVRVIGGAPPASGPVSLDFKQGRRARFVVGSDQEIVIEIPGYGITRTVGAGRTLVSFKAKKHGQFPVVVSPSHIDIAALRVARP
jgi:hypothetical protein